jgi:hypothetical protein
MRLYRLRSRDRLLRKLLSVRTETQWYRRWRSYQVFAVWQVYTRCLRPSAATRSDGVDKEIQSRAPSLYELLRSFCRSSAATPESQNAARIMSILSVICFSKHHEKCNFLPGLMNLLFQSAAWILYYESFRVHEVIRFSGNILRGQYELQDGFFDQKRSQGISSMVGETRCRWQLN